MLWFWYFLNYHKYNIIMIFSWWNKYSKTNFGIIWKFSSYWYFFHDDVIKRKHFPRYWPFVRGIHRSPVNSPHKGQWRRVLMFSLISAWINAWVNNRMAGDLRRHNAHCDITVMIQRNCLSSSNLIKILFCRHSIPDNYIATNVCTYHCSCAVISCAKCSHTFITSWMKAKQNNHSIRNMCKNISWNVPIDENSVSPSHITNPSWAIHII